MIPDPVVLLTLLAIAMLMAAFVAITDWRTLYDLLRSRLKSVYRGRQGRPPPDRMPDRNAEREPGQNRGGADPDDQGDQR